MSDLPRMVGATKPDTQVDVTVWRKGNSLDIKTTVGELSNAPSAEQAAPQAPDASPTDKLGLRVGPVTDASGSTQPSSEGVEVVEAQGVAAEAGIEQSDIVLRVNNTDITSVSQYAKLVGGLSSSMPSRLLLTRGDQTQR